MTQARSLRLLHHRTVNLGGEVFSGPEQCVKCLKLCDKPCLFSHLGKIQFPHILAEVLEVSVPRVHQLRAKALKDLRAILEG